LEPGSCRKEIVVAKTNVLRIAASMALASAVLVGAAATVVAAAPRWPQPGWNAAPPTQAKGKTGGAKTPKKRVNVPTASVEIAVPDTSWKLKILEVHQVKNRLLVLSRLTSEGQGTPGEATLRDSVKLPPGNDLPGQNYVLCKNWSGANPKGVTLITDRGEFDAKVKGGTKVYPVPGGGKKGKKKP
jgi:hypothetical protein